MQPSAVYLEKKLLGSILKAPDNRYQVRTHLLLSLWHLMSAMSIKITLVLEGRLSSCSFKRAALLYRLNVLNMRACQATSHVCAFLNREQGILVLQENVCSVIDIPAIFCGIRFILFLPLPHRHFCRISILMAGSEKPAASGAHCLLVFLPLANPVFSLSQSLHSKPGFFASCAPGLLCN